MSFVRLPVRALIARSTLVVAAVLMLSADVNVASAQLFGGSWGGGSRGLLSGGSWGGSRGGLRGMLAGRRPVRNLLGMVGSRLGSGGSNGGLLGGLGSGGGLLGLRGGGSSGFGSNGWASVGGSTGLTMAGAGSTGFTLAGSGSVGSAYPISTTAAQYGGWGSSYIESTGVYGGYGSNGYSSVGSSYVAAAAPEYYASVVPDYAPAYDAGYADFGMTSDIALPTDYGMSVDMGMGMGMGMGLPMDMGAPAYDPMMGVPIDNGFVDPMGGIPMGGIDGGIPIDNGIINGGIMGGFGSDIIGAPGGDTQIPTPATTDGAPDNGPPPTPRPRDDNDTTSADILGDEVEDNQDSVLSVVIPRSARVYINGKLTATPGARRSFVSRRLKKDKTYRYEVRAEMEIDGNKVEKTQLVRMNAGVSRTVEFEFEQPLTTMVSLRVPEDAKVELCGNTTKASGALRHFATSSLPEGKSWKDYKIVVSVERNGKTLSEEKSIELVAGETYDLAFDFDRVAAK